MTAVDSEVRRIEDHNVETWRGMARLMGGTVEFDTGLAVFWPEVPIPLFNRVIGIGRSGPVDMREFDRIVETYRANGTSWCVQLPTDLRDTQLRERLSDRGLTLHDRSAFLALTPIEWVEPEVADEIEFCEITNPDEASFVDVLLRSFEMPDSVMNWITEVARLPGITNYVGFIEGKPAATGMLNEVGGVAGLYSGGTLPEFRRRGLHAAMIAGRVKAAIDRGFDLICSETEAVDNQSFRDLSKQGFRGIITHENWGL